MITASRIDQIEALLLLTGERQLVKELADGARELLHTRASRTPPPNLWAAVMQRSQNANHQGDQ